MPHSDRLSQGYIPCLWVSCSNKIVWGELKRKFWAKAAAIVTGNLNPPISQCAQEWKRKALAGAIFSGKMFILTFSVFFSVCCFRSHGLRACLENMSSSLFPFLHPNHPQFILPPCLPNSAQLKNEVRRITSKKDKEELLQGDSL